MQVDHLTEYNVKRQLSILVEKICSLKYGKRAGGGASMIGGAIGASGASGAPPRATPLGLVTPVSVPASSSLAAATQSLTAHLDNERAAVESQDALANGSDGSAVGTSGHSSQASRGVAAKSLCVPCVPTPLVGTCTGCDEDRSCFRPAAVMRTDVVRFVCPPRFFLPSPALRPDTWCCRT